MEAELLIIDSGRDTEITSDREGIVSFEECIFKKCCKKYKKKGKHCKKCPRL